MEPQLTITIDDSPPEFRPGETLRGKARWRACDGATSAVVRLYWTTSGRGTTDTEVVAEQSLGAIGAEGDRSFEFALPAGPFSFSGQLITLSWGIELVVQPAGLGASAGFSLGRDGKEIRLPVLEKNRQKSSRWKPPAA